MTSIKDINSALSKVDGSSLGNANGSTRTDFKSETTNGNIHINQEENRSPTTETMDDKSKDTRTLQIESSKIAQKLTDDEVFDLDITAEVDDVESTEDQRRAVEQLLTDSRVEVSLVTSSAENSSSDGKKNDKTPGGKKTPSRNKKQTCIIKLEGCHYTIVANNIEGGNNNQDQSGEGVYGPTSGSLTLDDSAAIKLNKHLSRARSLTILKRPGEATQAFADIQLFSNCKVRTVKSEDIGDLRHDADDVINISRDELSRTDNLPPSDSTDALRICSIRLRELLRRLKSDDFEMKEVITNLEYAAKVSENIYCVEMSKLMGDVAPEDDDILGVVEPEGVPQEVRDWLTLTFTRSPGALAGKRTADDKLRFRSVAHAIRAGIVVDRIYRRTTSLSGQDSPTDIQIMLKSIDDWSFDVFNLNEKGEGHALRDVGLELLRRYDLMSKLKISKIHMEGFLLKLEAGYSRFLNPYHNLLHAADVTQTTSYVINQSGLTMWLTDVEIFAVLIAAMIHDYEHTGTTNTFHVNTSSALALMYNDRAVLENYHVSAAFRLIREDEQLGILSGLKPDEYREFRSMVIELVLATDMSSHFQQIKTMKSLLSVPDNIERTQVLSLIVHCCDISHPSKQWNLHHRWTSLLLEEFFRQGDRERALNLPISPLCDRTTTLVAESQIGFINFIVEPSFNVMSDSIDALMTSLQRHMMKEAENSAAEKPETVSNNEVKDGLSKAQQNFSVSRLKEAWSTCLNENLNTWKSRATPPAEKLFVALKRYNAVCFRNSFIELDQQVMDS